MQTSPSQVIQAENCLRLWAFGAVNHDYSPQNSDQSDGDDLHTINENYIRYGLDFPDTPMGRLARMGRDYLPTRADAPAVEQQVIVPYAGHSYKVKPDVTWYGPCGPIVMDYKVVTHYGFALTPQKLRAALQSACYAYRVMEQWREDSATVVWLYYKKSEPQEVRPVETEVTRDDVTRVMRARQALVDQMAGLKAERVSALDVVGNEGHCSAYKGCWYRPKCFPGRFRYNAEGRSEPVEVASGQWAARGG